MTMGIVLPMGDAVPEGEGEGNVVSEETSAVEGSASSAVAFEDLVAAEGEARITVLGRMKDVSEFAGRPLYDTWFDSGPRPPYADYGGSVMKANRFWIWERIKRGDQFWLVTDPAELTNVPGQPGYFTTRELRWLTQKNVPYRPMY
jgi:hypothetical protein